jgi:hypothetical protein
MGCAWERYLGWGGSLMFSTLPSTRSQRSSSEQVMARSGFLAPGPLNTAPCPPPPPPRTTQPSASPGSQAMQQDRHFTRTRATQSHAKRREGYAHHPQGNGPR